MIAFMLPASGSCMTDQGDGPTEEGPTEDQVRQEDRAAVLMMPRCGNDRREEIESRMITMSIPGKIVSISIAPKISSIAGSLELALRG